MAEPPSLPDGMPSDTDASNEPFFDGLLGQSLLGAGYLLVGVGLLYGLLTDWYELLLAVFALTVVLIAVSLYVSVRREGLLTAENRLIGAFVLLAMALFLGLTGYTDLPETVVFGVVFVVGVVVPHVLLEYTDYGRVD